MYKYDSDVRAMRESHNEVDLDIVDCPLAGIGLVTDIQGWSLGQSL